MNNWVRIGVPLMAVALAACGTTGNIQPTANTATAVPAGQGKATLDLSAYDRVVVRDFVDATGKNHADATRTFPDLIAGKLRDTGVFREVSREPSPGKALVISGSITRLEEGSAALRFLVGMGAGSSYFDATTELSDADSGASLGRILTDKNSWALGGGIAATQTPQTFMEGAAVKIADEVRDSKLGKVAKAH